MNPINPNSSNTEPASAAVESVIPGKLANLQTLASHDEVAAEYFRGEGLLLGDAFVKARMAPIGTVVVDDSGQTPTPDDIRSRVNAGQSPDGREALGVWTRDDAYTQHYFAPENIAACAISTMAGGRFGLGNRSAESNGAWRVTA